MPAILRLYAWVGREALNRAARAWPVALSVLLYEAILILASMLLGPLGLAGGFIYGLVVAACLSGYLHLLGLAVGKSKLSWTDLKDGFLALLWDVMGLLFALWIVGWAVDMVAKNAGDHAVFVNVAYEFTVFVMLNPVPEIISQRRARGRTMELLTSSVQFVQQHWIEWFVPQIVLALLLSLPLLWAGGFFRTGGGIGMVGTDLLAFLYGGLGLLTLLPILMVLHYFMVFRGLLFQELSNGNWRVRAFRSRTRA